MTFLSNNKIPYAVPYFNNKETEYVVDALNSTWISGGKYVDDLEDKLAKIHDVNKVLVVSNGTTAIHLAYLGLAIKPGDEIIFPAWGFMGGTNIALHLGAVPIFADVDPDTWLVTAEEIEKKITNKTKAIFVTHTYGNVCNMEEITILAKKYNLYLIEDCAESPFSKYNNQYCGTFGDMGVFSMQATKTLTTGEGGFVICNNKEMIEKMHLYRSHGLSKRGVYYHALAGHNFRLTNIQAAIGCAQVEKLDEIIEGRGRVYNLYKSLLEGQVGITLQKIEDNVKPLMWVFGIKIDNNIFKRTNLEIVNTLSELGIEIRPGFLDCSRLNHLYEYQWNLNASNLSATTINLPIYPTLTNEQVEYICEELLRLR